MSVEAPPKTRKAPVVAGLMLTLAMAALEATVVSTAMPTVIGDLGGLEYYSWVATAYLVSSSISVPLYGKLADMYGRKPLLMIGIALFLLGSIASGASTSMSMLIAFRAFQGLGAGAMQPVAMTVIGDIFDLKQRAKVQGVFGAAWGFFGLVGPLLGGFIVAHVSWRWVFYMNIPFGIAAALLIATSLHESIEKRERTLDIAGAALLMMGMAALLFATDRPRFAEKAIAMVSALVLLGAFVIVERRAKEPVLPLELLSRPVLAVSSPVGAIIGGALLGVLTYVPLFVQGVLLGTPTQAGTAITPMVIGWPLMSAISGRILPKVGFRPLIRIGLFTTAVSGVMLAVYGTHDTLWMLRITTFLFGAGMGLANTALLIAVQTSVPWKERGVATASTLFFRTLGGAVAVGVIGGVINSALARNPSIPPEATGRILTRTSHQSPIDPAIVKQLSGVLGGALGTAFWIIGALSVIAFLLSLLFPKVVPDAAAPSKTDETSDPPEENTPQAT